MRTDTFEEIDLSLETFGISGIRCAKFHPIDPVLACGLLDTRVVILRGANHSVLFADWKIERELQPKSLALELEWNVRADI